MEIILLANSCHAHGHSHLHLPSRRPPVQCHWSAEVLPHLCHNWHPWVCHHGTQPEYSSTVCWKVHDHCLLQCNRSNHQCSDCWDCPCWPSRQLCRVPLLVWQLGNIDCPQLWIFSQWLENLSLDLHCTRMYSTTHSLLLSLWYSILACWKRQVGFSCTSIFLFFP